MQMGARLSSIPWPHFDSGVVCAELTIDDDYDDDDDEDQGMMVMMIKV